MRKHLLLLLLVLAAAGCEDRYRYPCQNPAKKDLPECQEDACKATRTCNDMTYGNKKGS